MASDCRLDFLFCFFNCIGGTERLRAFTTVTLKLLSFIP